MTSLTTQTKSSTTSNTHEGSNRYLDHSPRYTQKLRSALRPVAKLACYSLAFAGCFTAGMFAYMPVDETPQDSLDPNYTDEQMINWLALTVGFASVSISGTVLALLADTENPLSLPAQCHETGSYTSLKSDKDPDIFYDASDSFETLLLRELAISTFPTLFISSTATAYSFYSELWNTSSMEKSIQYAFSHKMLYINIAPIVLSGLLNITPLITNKLAENHLSPINEKRVKNVLSILPAVMMGLSIGSSGIVAIGCILGAYGADILAKSIQKYLTAKKTIQTNEDLRMRKKHLGLLRAISPILGYYIGRLLVGVGCLIGTDHTISEKELVKLNTRVQHLPNLISCFRALREPCIKQPPRWIYDSRSLTQNQSGICEITPKESRFFYETLTKHTNYPKEPLRKALKKLDIDYDYFSEPSDLKSIQKILGPLREITRGAMSQVYLSPDYPNQIIRVQKNLLKSYPHLGSAVTIQTSEQKFAMVLATHNLMSIHGYAPKINRLIEFENIYVLIMDKFKGDSFTEFKNANIPYLKRLRITITILKAIHHMHTLGIAHFDLHIHNLLINQQTEQVNILDFDFAKYIHTTYTLDFFPPREKIEDGFLSVGLLGKKIMRRPHEALNIILEQYPNAESRDDDVLKKTLEELVEIARGLRINTEVIEKLEAIHEILLEQLEPC